VNWINKRKLYNTLITNEFASQLKTTFSNFLKIGQISIFETFNHMYNIIEIFTHFKKQEIKNKTISEKIYRFSNKTKFLIYNSSWKASKKLDWNIILFKANLKTASNQFWNEKQKKQIIKWSKNIKPDFWKQKRFFISTINHSKRILNHRSKKFFNKLQNFRRSLQINCISTWNNTN
jgi:hypothetical protein